MGRKKINSQLVVNLSFVPYLLTFYFLNPLYFLMLPFKLTITTGSAENVKSYIPLQSRIYSRSSAGPKPARLFPAPSSAGLPLLQVWPDPSCGRHSVSVRYHLAVPTAPAQSAAGQIPQPAGHPNFISRFLGKYGAKALLVLYPGMAPAAPSGWQRCFPGPLWTAASILAIALLSKLAVCPMESSAQTIHPSCSTQG